MESYQEEVTVIDCTRIGRTYCTVTADVLSLKHHQHFFPMFPAPKDNLSIIHFWDTF